jgi:hypothetical protein
MASLEASVAESVMRSIREVLRTAIACEPTQADFRLPRSFLLPQRQPGGRYGLPVAPIEITERRAFSRAIASGRALTESHRTVARPRRYARFGMDQDRTMSSKPTGLAAFTNKTAAAAPAPAKGVNKRAEGDTVALTVRLPRSEWVRHQLGVSESVSLQTLAIRRFDKVFAEQGLHTS